MPIPKNETLYLCDPNKNKECQKSSCQIRCKYTANKDFAKTDENELSIIETLKAQIREMRNLQIEITSRKLRKYLKLSKQINETVRLLYEID